MYSSAVKDAIFKSDKVSSGFIMEYWFAVNPLYAERHARRNIFFPQIVETFVGSNLHH